LNVWCVTGILFTPDEQNYNPDPRRRAEDTQLEAAE